MSMNEEPFDYASFEDAPLEISPDEYAVRIRSVVAGSDCILGLDRSGRIQVAADEGDAVTGPS